MIRLRMQLMRIMSSMVQNRGVCMEEKRYKVVKSSGALCIVAGVLNITIGVTLGVLLIVSGARLIASKSKNLF